jgi:hypothetical protein
VCYDPDNLLRIHVALTKPIKKQTKEALIMELEDTMEMWLAEKGWQIGDDTYISHKLMFHYALLINANGNGYEQRYCYKNLPLLVKAVEEFKETGKLRYWHKDHSNNKSVNGKYLYEAGMLTEPKYSIGEVDWVV